MELRRDLKRKLISARCLLRDPKKLGPSFHQNLLYKVDSLEKQLISLVCSPNVSMITAGREVIAQNVSLQDIFTHIWMIVSDLTENGYLTKKGYIRFELATDCALFGPHKISNQFIEHSFVSDETCFGKLNRDAFFDLLYELLETWSELVEPSFYGAFAWALLVAISDTHKFPPNFRPYNQIECFLFHNNSVKLLGTLRLFFFLYSVPAVCWLFELFRNVYSRQKASECAGDKCEHACSFTRGADALTIEKRRC
jgi:hypothetical protein